MKATEIREELEAVRKRLKWLSVARAEDIARRLLAGEHPASIARSYGIHPQVIRRIARQHGTTAAIRYRAKWDPIIRDYIAGEKLEVIAAEHGISGSHARHLAKQAGVVRRFGTPRTHCLFGGHELAGDNLRISRDGHRYCKACALARQRRNRAAKRQASPPPGSPETLRNGY